MPSRRYLGRVNDPPAEDRIKEDGDLCADFVVHCEEFLNGSFWQWKREVCTQARRTVKPSEICLKLPF